MAKPQEEKNLLNMAGEFLVAAELNRRGILCAVTYGTAKCADVWGFTKSGDRAVRIEVKTTGPDTQRWVIGDKPQKQQDDPSVFYVLVKLPSPHPTEPHTSDERRGRHAPRFFVFTLGELRQFLDKEAQVYQESYRRKHDCDFTGRGVPNVALNKAVDFENRWDKVVMRVGEE